MKKTKKAIGWCMSTLLMLITLITGANAGVMLADASNLPDAGKTEGGNGGVSTPPAGIATETEGRKDGDPEFYTKDIDSKIVKIRPMATPVDQISRYAKAQHSDSFEVKYYSVGTRPIRCTTSDDINAQVSGASISLPVDDANMFTLDDTIRVVGIKAKYDYQGVAYDQDDENTPDLVLCVCGKNSETGMPTVYAVNGNKDASGATIYVPAIPAGTKLVRMGKACGELDVQTGRFNNIPTSEIQYCQNFMIQIEQSKFDEIASKEVDWSFSDIEEDGIYDMRLAQENTFLWGDKHVIYHPTKDGMATWFTGGIWYMAGKDIEVGEWDNNKQCAVISDDNLVDITKDLFVGTGIGNKRKILFCGSDLLSAFSKIKSDKFRLKDTVEVWNLKFKSWDTDFGEVLTIHHELFDLNGMSDCGFAMDPEYLTKKTHVSWGRNILDLKKAGIRNTNAVVLQEVSCLYLRYAKAHARMRLAQSPTVTGITLSASTMTLHTTGTTQGQLSATLSPEGASAPISWSSSNTSIATVNDSGKVTAVAAGSATITATCGAFTATCTVTVVGKVANPTFSPSEEAFDSSVDVTLASTTGSASIYYTTDGTNPTSASTLYSGAITLSATTTIKAIAIKDGMDDSDVVSKTYTKN